MMGEEMWENEIHKREVELARLKASLVDALEGLKTAIQLLIVMAGWDGPYLKKDKRFIRILEIQRDVKEVLGED